MPMPIDRDGLRRLVQEQGAQVVEVLPREEFEWAHLPGAEHLSLKEFSAETARARLDVARPVVLYCNDFL